MDDPVRGGKNWSSIFDFLMTNEIQVIFCYMQIFFAEIFLKSSVINLFKIDT